MDTGEKLPRIGVSSQGTAIQFSKATLFPISNLSSKHSPSCTYQALFGWLEKRLMLMLMLICCERKKNRYFAETVRLINSSEQVYIWGSCSL
jgi:hypothetical protein